MVVSGIVVSGGPEFAICSICGYYRLSTISSPHLRLCERKTRAASTARCIRVRSLVDLTQYLPILIFLVIALGLSIVFVFLPIGVSYLTGAHNPNSEKLSEYECGFPAFESARSQFDVRFYLVAILFLIFDLEVAFLFPWAVSLGQIGWVGWSAMMIFLVILTVGFVYEWKKGALNWE